jgi:hypothetical protein
MTKFFVGKYKWAQCKFIYKVFTKWIFLCDVGENISKAKKTSIKQKTRQSLCYMNIGTDPIAR